ncbi:GNAT family N-acetyltransferase [Enterococcus sp.]|uniref:GNAT family N-acetyltransferase n=1 Tax=Enterococcus sp. TaxID=35783 RepID=UPI0025BA5347|nr:GNAT family N-acetyltransferase [Enterococcus sp.]
MTVRIEEVTQSTWRTVAALQVSESQRAFIEDNTTSLLEAAYDTSLHWIPLALYKEETIVGFAMVGAYNQQEQSIWLDRLMIDQRWQKLGLGKKFMPLLLDYLFSHWTVEKIYLSAHRENEKIFSFYTVFGFSHTGKIDPENGELIMIYTKTTATEPC